ncbi:MAG: hypothetical protein OXI43_10570 [Candidatus Poribacteria bacterium]|nr:hypothetical protein [Candidatus Poribacteria bacterium]
MIINYRSRVSDTISINFFPLPVVRNKAECGTNWKFMLQERDLIYQKWYDNTRSLPTTENR